MLVILELSLIEYKKLFSIVIMYELFCLRQSYNFYIKWRAKNKMARGWRAD
jgi:hypothetical protein